MDLPPDSTREPTNDRRAVPRHIRDGEHDMIDEAMGQPPVEKTNTGRMLLWFCLVVLAAGAVGLWLANRGG